MDEPPPDFLPDCVQPAKQFFFARDQVAAAKSEMQWQASASPDYGLQDVQLEETKEEDGLEETDEIIAGAEEEAAEKKEESAPASSGWQQDEALLEQRLAGLPRDVKWEATKSKAHFITEEGEPPWCAQRQGQRAKKLVRLVAKRRVNESLAVHDGCSEVPHLRGLSAVGWNLSEKLCVALPLSKLCLGPLPGVPRSLGVLRS